MLLNSTSHGCLRLDTTRIATLLRKPCRGQISQTAVGTIMIIIHPPSFHHVFHLIDVQEQTHSLGLRKQKWKTYHVKDGRKRPMVWRAKHLMVWWAECQKILAHKNTIMNPHNPYTWALFSSNP